MPPRPSKIVCVGRNYLEHARELGNEMPEQPLLFLKPPSSLVRSGETILLPPESNQVDHEAEIGVIIRRRCSRADGQWTRGKGFDTFCPLGEAVEATGSDPTQLEVVGRVNGEVRQRGSASQMAFPIPVLIEYISGIMTLEPGDVIATGTPAGVGPLKDGDVVVVEVPGVGTLSNPVRAR